MNVTALLDTPARSTAPLDPAVGDDASDPAFANVMSQYQSNDNKSLTSGAQSEATEPNGTAPVDSAAAPNAGGSAAVDDSAALEAGAAADASGEPLPPPIGIDGRTLPPIDAVMSATTPAKPDDPSDAVDASAVASMVAAVPLPPPVASTTVAALPTAPPTDIAAAPRTTADPAPPPVVLDAEASAPADADAPLPVPPIDPRAIKKDGDAAVIAQATAPTASDDTALHSGSVVHALRALGLGHGQASADGQAAQNPGDNRHRGSNGSSVDPLRNDAAPKIIDAHLAAAVEAAAQKDPATQHRDGDSSIRTDAVSPRANGPVEAARDTAATRLGDLAQQHAPRFAAELADRVLVLRSQRFDAATVSLEPRDLGRIDIQVRLQADTTHVAFTTQHAVVRDALEGQMPRLRALLEEAGLSLGNVDVAHSGHRGAGDSGTARSYAPQSSAAIDADVDSSSRWQRRVETSIIDLHA